MNIYQKLNKIMQEVDYVQKKGFNAFHKYKYASESDYLQALRPHLVKHGLMILPSIQGVSQPTGSNVTTISIKYTIVNIDIPEEKIEMFFSGSGEDKGDKGLYKAVTGSKKYFLSNLFLMPTGDDPEDDSKEEHPEPTKKLEVRPALEVVASTPKEEAPVAKSETKKSSFRRVGQPASEVQATGNTPKSQTGEQTNEGF